MFTFCPLQGALSESTASQSLLELDGGVKVLIDVGWDESFDAENLRELEKQVPTISLVLLTHATISHIAAFAHCCKHFPQFARIPFYATKPVIDLGRTLLQDLYASTPLAASTIPRGSLAEASYSYSQTLSAENSHFLLQPPTADEINRYFSLIRELKYSQPHQPQGPPNLPPLNGLTITAYNAGRTLGGTIWHIQLGLESIVYGGDWGQYKENVFSSAAWLVGGSSDVNEQLHKPTALISSSRAPAVLRPGLRDDQLLQTIRTHVARGGTVLLPTDSSARVLELAYLLEHAWRQDALASQKAKEFGNSGENGVGTLCRSKLYLAGRTSGSLMRHARTLLEWMNDSIVQEFEAVADGAKQNGKANGGGGGAGGHGGDDGKARGTGPFVLQYMRLLERQRQVDRVLNNPAPSGGGKVILASDSSVEWGFSKEIMRRIAESPRNLVLLTEVPGALSGDRQSVARTLWEWWHEQMQNKGDAGMDVDTPGSRLVHADGRPLVFCDSRKVLLDGAELALYQQWLATQRQLQATVQTGGPAALLEPFAVAGDDGVSSSASSSSSDDSEQSDSEPRQGKVLNISTTMGQASRKKVVLKDEDLGVTILIKRKGHYDFDVRGKKGRERVFPLAVRRKRNDDFGEIIRADEYLREEEREEAKGGDGSGAANGNRADGDGGGLGKKRKWEDMGGPGKRSRSDRDEGWRAGPGRGGRGAGPGRGGDDRREENEGARDSDADSDGSDADDRPEDDEDLQNQQLVVGPAKMIYTTDTVSAQLSIGYVDFSGLHTDRNLEMLLPLLEPRKLILVGGSTAETEAAAVRYRNVVSRSRGVAAADVDVLSPAVGVTVDASVDTHAWVVRLADALVKKLRWQNLGGMGLVTLTGELSAASSASTTGSGTGSTSAVSTSTPALPLLDVPTTAVARTTATQPLHVGELRLADLRRAMQGVGHTAEFRGEGTLVIDGSVAVRKTATGRVEVESIGLASDGGPGMRQGGTFYAVKKMIYEGLAVVAGG